MNKMNKTRRKQHGGELPFFGNNSLTSWLTPDKNKVNEEAELNKETENIKNTMDRLKRKLEAYERKMTKLESLLTYYQDLATKALKMHDMYEEVLNTLQGTEEEREEEEDLGSDEDLDLPSKSVEDSAVD